MSLFNEKVMDFINAMRELWDGEDSSFRNRVAKKSGWEAVGKEFGITGNEIDQKFKNLRTYFQKEREKEKSGNGASKKKLWFAFEGIQFALARNVPNAGIDSENSTVKLSYERLQITPKAPETFCPDGGTYHYYLET